MDACLPHARHVLDRFHVIRWFAAGLTAVRRDIQRREPHGVKPAFDPEVFRARFLLLRRGDTLAGADQARLDALFGAHPRLKAAWQALQELHGLYTADDHQGALEALGRFCDLYETGELPEFHDIVDTFIAWSDEILGWHHTQRASNGRIEGTNTHTGGASPAGAGLTRPGIQGREMARWRDIESALGVEVYFCEPPFAVAAAQQRANQWHPASMAAQEHRPERRRGASRRHRGPSQLDAPQAPQLELSPQRLHRPHLHRPVELAQY